MGENSNNQNDAWLSQRNAISKRSVESKDNLAIDAAKAAFNPDDPSVKHPHPHGNASYDVAGDMDTFIKSTQEAFERRKNSGRHSGNDTPVINQEGNVKSSPDIPPEPVKNSGIPQKEITPLIPITFYCWKEGTLGYIDLFGKFNFTPQ